MNRMNWTHSSTECRLNKPFKPSPSPVVHRDACAAPYSGGEIFSWNEGMPRTKDGKSLAKEQLQQIYHAAAAAPYIGDWNPLTSQYEVEPEFQGMTNAEVAILRQARKAANGDQKATETFFDRLLGKPKQAVESISMRMSYSEYLDLLAQQEADEPEDDSQVIEATVTPISIFDPLPDDVEDLLDGV